MMYIYFRTKNDELIDNRQISFIARITKGEIIDPEDFVSIRNFAINECRNIDKEIVPSINYLLKNGRKVEAIKVLYRKNDGKIGLPDCKRIIDNKANKLISKERSDN